MRNATAAAKPAPVPSDDIEADGETVSGSAQAGVQSVEIAANILKALAGGGSPLPLKGVAKAAHMSRAKVHRYLVSLKRAGLVAQDARSGDYRIGPAAVTLGLVGLRGLSPVRTMNDALPGLRDRIDETVTLAIWGETGPVIIAMEEPSKPITINVRIGSVLSLGMSAIGRTFVAFMPEGTTRDAIARERALAAADGNNIYPDAAGLSEVLAEIHTRRMARVRGTLMPGIDALAAPIFDHTGKVIAVICSFGRAGSFDSRLTGKIAQILAEVTADLSRQFGFADGVPVG
jgi:DNA-binding IclR family transcriptional regulator